MTSVADFLSAGSARDKVVTAAEAIQLIRDGDTVAIDTFMTELSSVIRNCAEASVSRTIPVPATALSPARLASAS